MSDIFYRNPSVCTVSISALEALRADLATMTAQRDALLEAAATIEAVSGNRSNFISEADHDAVCDAWAKRCCDEAKDNERLRKQRDALLEDKERLRAGINMARSYLKAERFDDAESVLDVAWKAAIDAAKGGQQPILPCPTCEGDGWNYDNDLLSYQHTCTRCKGTGVAKGGAETLHKPAKAAIEAVSDIQRYDGPDDNGWMPECGDGDWVKYDDHVAQVGAKAAIEVKGGSHE